METAQDRMLKEYEDSVRNLGQSSIKLTYKQRLKLAMEEGLLIFTKYGLALILAFLALQFLTGIISGSRNGTNSALYLNELITKGYLPKAENGVIPVRGEGNAQANPVK